MSDKDPKRNLVSVAHPVEKRYAAAKALVSTGNLRVAAELAEIPMETLRYWRKTDWWPQVYEEAKQEQRQELASRLGKIANTALEIMEDRLTNGEHILNNKTGEIMRKPVGLRDANQAANNIMTQRIKLEELSEKVSTRDETISEVLKQLATEFTKINRKQQQQKAVDVPFVEEVKSE